MLLASIRRSLLANVAPSTGWRALPAILPPCHRNLRPFSVTSASIGTTATEAIGVSRALRNKTPPTSTLLTQDFALIDRVALISGGNSGLGLESALAMAEAGARAVYCVDLPEHPSAEWQKVRDYAAKLKGKGGEGRLEYVSADVRNQDKMWQVGEMIGDKEGRMDICLAGAGVLGDAVDCLEYPGREFQRIMETNVHGVLWTAQAAGQQMRRFKNGGSIILMASIAAHVAFKGHAVAQYHTSKAAVLQLARSLACELAPEGIRVNSVSPGFMLTRFPKPYLDVQPEYEHIWSSMNPMKRMGKPHEIRGVMVWLASDASSFCNGSDILVDGGHHAW